MLSRHNRPKLQLLNVYDPILAHLRWRIKTPSWTNLQYKLCIVIEDAILRSGCPIK